MKLTYSIQVFHKQFKMSCCELLLTENQCILQSREFVIGIGIDSVSLDDNGLVLNFSFIKCEMKKLISEFNKKILIATKKPDQILEKKFPNIKISDSANNYFSFPLKNCILLKCNCLTTKYLSRIFALRIKSMLLDKEEKNILSVNIMISEDNFNTGSNCIIIVNKL